MCRARSCEEPRTGSRKAGMFVCWSLLEDTSATSPPSPASSSSLVGRYLALGRDRWGFEHGLTVRRMAVAGRLQRGFDYGVDQAIVLGHLGRHEEVALDVALDLLRRAAGVLGVNADDDLPQPQDLVRVA